MKKLCTKGHKISAPDMKALEHYLLDSPKEWAQKALNGMINKAVKTIYKDWFKIYKSKAESNVTNISNIIMGIIEMPEFKPYHSTFNEKEIPERDDPRDIEIWGNGFEVEDYEDAAIRAFYADPEQTLYDFMENKVAKRKNRFIKDNEPILLIDQSVTSIPSKKDKFIKEFIKRSDYKNRRKRDEVVEIILQNIILRNRK